MALEDSPFHRSERYLRTVRAAEKRAIEAVSNHLSDVARTPAPNALAAVIGTALGASGCALTVTGTRHQWGHHSGPWVEHSVEYGGRVQGILAVAPESTGAVPELAAVLGAPLAAIRSTTETDRLLRESDAAARELVDDRWKATVEMERERRGLERDLHDGAQHHLVALRMAVALTEHAGATPDRIDTLLSKLDTAAQVLIDTATGILPARLVSDGLAAALRASLAEHEHVVLDTSQLRGRHPPLIESTVYFACLEVVNNAHKHAPGAPIAVRAHDNRRGLEFVVADGGPGFAVDGPEATLPNLSARLAIVGGTVALRSVPGRGTTVTGYVPS